jgi:hypothetical protein
MYHCEVIQLGKAQWTYLLNSLHQVMLIRFAEALNLIDKLLVLFALDTDD